jgi:SET domain-containing protein
MPIYTPGQSWQPAYLLFEKETFSRGILEIATEDGLLPEGFMSLHSAKQPFL